MTTIGIIPCRYQSVRFPGKPLAEINGKPMMWHVYGQALKCPALDAVYIATEDRRIEDSCRELDLNVLMTRSDHPTGTDRVAECVAMVDADFYVNIQGDEPMIDPVAITVVVDSIRASTNPRVVASNAYARIESASDAVDVNNVKVVLAQDGTAMAFSRQPIPYPKGGEVVYLRQLGLYAFRKSALQIFSELIPGPVECAEGVEMLRFVEHGHQVQMIEVQDKSIPVDTEADLQRVRELMKDAG